MYATYIQGWYAHPCLTIGYPMAVARIQTLVQLNDDLLALLDERASRSRRSRSELIREAIEMYLHEEREAEIDRQIAESYRRFPDDEVDYTQAARRLIREEPW